MRIAQHFRGTNTLTEADVEIKKTDGADFSYIYSNVLKRKVPTTRTINFDETPAQQDDPIGGKVVGSATNSLFSSASVTVTPVILTGDLSLPGDQHKGTTVAVQVLTYGPDDGSVPRFYLKALKKLEKELAADPTRKHLQLRAKHRGVGNSNIQCRGSVFVDANEHAMQTDRSMSRFAKGGL